MPASHRPTARLAQGGGGAEEEEEEEEEKKKKEEEEEEEEKKDEEEDGEVGGEAAAAALSDRRPTGPRDAGATRAPRCSGGAGQRHDAGAKLKKRRGCAVRTQGAHRRMLLMCARSILA